MAPAARSAAPPAAPGRGSGPPRHRPRRGPPRRRRRGHHRAVHFLSNRVVQPAAPISASPDVGRDQGGCVQPRVSADETGTQVMPCDAMRNAMRAESAAGQPERGDQRPQTMRCHAAWNPSSAMRCHGDPCAGVMRCHATSQAGCHSQRAGPPPGAGARPTSRQLPAERWRRMAPIA